MAKTVTIALPNGAKYEQPTGQFIGNQFVQGSGDCFSTYPQWASTTDVDKAVAAAREAFNGPWSQLPAIERGAYLYKLAELIDRNRELLAAIDAYDNGKTFSGALTGDLDEAYNVFRYYAGAADKISGQTIETSPAKLAYVVQEPLGVCAQIVPWNYPFMMLAWKIAPALACGNTVVLKPAEQTPLSALYFGNLVIEAGLPAGVVNIISGLGPTTGSALANHADVDKVAFTGSTATGKSIMKAAASNLKNVTLECGGKSPSVVFADADFEQAVKWTHFGIMENSGEVCTSTSRIYVEESIYDKFVERFVEVTQDNDKVGDNFNEATYYGAQISKTQFDKVLGYIEDGKKRAAKLLYGGARSGSQGYFIQPTVFVDTTEDMKIVREEIFGPVVVISFKTEDEVVYKCNDTSYGLAAALFTENVSKAHLVARRLQAGMVWINSSGDSHFGIPFGGYKSSGIGRELGKYALDAYTQAKAVHVNLGSKL
uniref:Aldehyde dehydrogenase domain-containing protein n=1 Tax=Bionectria ochroleuca TaxID=29856 RepID=A0A8H7TWQ6_BIOOC